MTARSEPRGPLARSYRSPAAAPTTPQMRAGRPAGYYGRHTAPGRGRVTGTGAVAAARRRGLLHECTSCRTAAVSERARWTSGHGVFHPEWCCACRPELSRSATDRSRFLFRVMVIPFASEMPRPPRAGSLRRELRAVSLCFDVIVRNSLGACKSGSDTRLEPLQGMGGAGCRRERSCK